MTTARYYSFVLVCAVTIRGVTQICLTVSGLCVDMKVFVGGCFIIVCRCGSVYNQIKVHIRGCRKVVKTGWKVVRPWMGSYRNCPCYLGGGVGWFLVQSEGLGCLGIVR